MLIYYSFKLSIGEKKKAKEMERQDVQISSTLEVKPEDHGEDFSPCTVQIPGQESIGDLKTKH